MTQTAKSHVVLLATGGTIASRAQSLQGGATVASDTAETLLHSVPAAGSLPVRVRDVLRTGSYAMSVDDMLLICAHIRGALTDPAVVGVVVAHGTDTMEETAFLADLLHDDPRPVVFTGAQRAADTDRPDGPRNLAAAIALASSADARGHGVLLCFAGQVFPALGVRKEQTEALNAFANPDVGAVGAVSGNGVALFATPAPRPAALPMPPVDSSSRVDVVASYPGADATLLRAAAHAGAAGLVLQGTGNGNANAALCAAVAELCAQDITVVTSTRVSAGPVRAVYGAGGGVDLLAAGAVPSGILRPSQSFVLLSLLLRLGRSPAEIAETFASRSRVP